MRPAPDVKVTSTLFDLTKGELIELIQTHQESGIDITFAERDNARELAGKVLNKYHFVERIPRVGAKATELKAVERIPDVGKKAAVFNNVVPRLSPEEMPQALKVVGTLDERHQTAVLNSLTPRLPDDLKPKAFEVAMGINNDEQRAHAIMATINHLPADLKPTAVAEARKATYGIPNDKLEHGQIGARVDRALEQVRTANSELRNNNNFNLREHPAIESGRANALLQQRDFNQQSGRNASPPALQQQRETPTLGLPSNHHAKTL